MDCYRGIALIVTQVTRHTAYRFYSDGHVGHLADFILGEVEHALVPRSIRQ